MQSWLKNGLSRRTNLRAVGPLSAPAALGRGVGVLLQSRADTPGLAVERQSVRIGQTVYLVRAVVLVQGFSASRYRDAEHLEAEPCRMLGLLL